MDPSSIPNSSIISMSSVDSEIKWELNVEA